MHRLIKHIVPALAALALIGGVVYTTPTESITSTARFGGGVGVRGGGMGFRGGGFDAGRGAGFYYRSGPGYGYRGYDYRPGYYYDQGGGTVVYPQQTYPQYYPYYYNY